LLIEFIFKAVTIVSPKLSQVFVTFT